MPTLTAVEGDPFAASSGAKLTPVKGNPFATSRQPKLTPVKGDPFAAAPAPSPSPKPAPIPTGRYGETSVSAPKPRSLWERFEDEVSYAFHNTSLTNTVADEVMRHIPAYDPTGKKTGDQRREGQRRSIAAARQEAAGVKQRKDEADPAWRKGPGNLAGNLAREVASFGGGAVGDIDPTYLVGGPVKNLAGRAAFQGGFQGFRDTAQQLLRMHLGQQKDYDPYEAGSAAAGGAVLHVVGEVAAPVVRAALHPVETSARVGAGYAAGGFRGATRAAVDRGFVTGKPEDWRYTGGKPGEINKAGAKRAATAASKPGIAVPFKPGNKRRGADHAMQVMDDAANAGHIPRETAEFGKWFIKKNPALANEVNVVVQRGGRGLQGFYDPTSRLVALMKGDTMDRTAVHELLHHTERLLPDKSREAIRAAWSKAVDTLAKGPENLRVLANAIRQAEAGERNPQDLPGLLPSMKYYQYVNPSEYWAENASRLLAARRSAEGSRFAGAALWLKEFAEHAKGSLGLQSDAPALRAIRDVLEHKTGKTEGEMLRSGGKISDPTPMAIGGAMERVEIEPTRPLKAPTDEFGVTTVATPRGGKLSTFEGGDEWGDSTGHHFTYTTATGKTAKGTYKVEGNGIVDFAIDGTGANSVGPGERGDVLGALAAAHPEANTLTAVRVTGARKGSPTAIGLNLERYRQARAPARAEMASPRQAVAPILRRAGALRDAVGDGRDAEVYADLQRAIVGRHKLDAARAAAELAKHQRTVGNASEAEQRALIDAVETRSQGGAMGLRGPMRAAADAIRKVALDYRSRIEAVMKKDGSEENVPKFIQDYFVHLWKNPPKEVEAAMIGKQGSGRNLKKRTLPTYAEGLEAGLIPVHENPLDAMTAYVDNMSRFLAAHQLREEMHRAGLAKWEFEKGADPSRIKLNGGHTVIDAMKRPLNPNVAEEDQAEQGLIGRRILTASPEVAKRYNAFVDPGLVANLRRQGKNKRALAAKVVGKAMGISGQTVLSGSLFHPTLVAGKAIGSELAIGINHLLRGRPVEAAKTLWYAPTAPVRAAYAGRQMGKRLLEGDHAMTEIDELWRDAGNRFNNGSVYRASIRPNFLTSALRGTLKGDIRSALKATTRGSAGIRAAAVVDLFPRMLESLSAPVFDHYVPAIKRGVFEREMGAELAANPGWSAAEKRAAARRISDNIDGRLGEMSTDNLFWSQTRTDMLRLAFLSPSWVYGDVKLVLDAMRDMPKSITGLFQGKGVGHGVAAVGGVAGSYMLMNGIANYLYTGEAPKGEDWIAFRTGTFHEDKDGNLVPDRAVIPSVMKDFFGAMKDPIQEAWNKLHPEARTAAEVARNKDWRELPIARPAGVEMDDLERITNDIPENIKQPRAEALALHALGGTVVPFGLQQAFGGDVGGLGVGARILGIRPAGRSFTDPEGDAQDAKNRGIRAVAIEASADAKAKARKEKP